MNLLPADSQMTATTSLGPPSAEQAPPDSPGTAANPGASSSLPRWTVWFCGLSAALLALGALGKGIALWMTRLPPLIDPPDPVLPFLSSRTLIGLTALAELLLAGWVWKWRRHDVGCWALGWWVAALLLYRPTRYALGVPWEGGCSCLGAVPKWFGLGERAGASMALGMLVFWSLGWLFWYFGGRGSAPIRQTALLLSVALVPHVSAVDLTTHHLVLQGRQDYVFFYENGAVQQELSMRFVVRLAADTWFLESDGMQAFGLSNNTLRATFTNPSAPPAGGANAGYFPLFASTGITFPWLAYCSGLWFRHTPDWGSLPMINACALTDPRAHMCEAHVALLDEEHFIPAHITWITTEERLKNANKSPYLQILEGDSEEEWTRHLDYSQLYPTGLLCTEYKVLASTNVGGVTLPLQAQITVFLQKGRWPALSGEPYTPRGPRHITDGSSVRETFLRSRTLLTLTNAWIAAGPIPLRDLIPDNCGITDRRLQSRRWGVDYVYYEVHSRDQWKFVPDAELTNLFRIKLREHQRAAAIRYAIQGVAYMGFALLVVVPTYLIWRRYGRPPAREPSSSGPAQGPAGV